MKIATIQCSGGLNIGNEFINAGGSYLIESLYPKNEIFSFEFYDSFHKDTYKHPSEPFTKSSFQYINSCDVIFIFCGSIISERAERILSYLAETKPKKVLLGAGAYLYNEKEKSICKKIAKNYDYIFTRDDITFSYFNGASNAYSGIDLAFFADHKVQIPKENGNYAVVNIDSIEGNRHSIIQNKVKELKRSFDEVFVVVNTTQKVTDLKNYLYLSYWESFYNLYANASHVVTTRIHTAVVCVVNSVSFEYLGKDSGGITGRNTLFKKMDLNLEKGRHYQKELLISLKPKIEVEKINFIKDLKEILNSLN